MVGSVLHLQGNEWTARTLFQLVLSIEILYCLLLRFLQLDVPSKERDWVVLVVLVVILIAISALEDGAFVGAG